MLSLGGSSRTVWSGVRRVQSSVHKLKNDLDLELVKDTSVTLFVVSLPIANGINDTENVVVSAMYLSERNIW